MAHLKSEEAENILDYQFTVLDRGYIKLIDYMGTDERVFHAAGMSYGRDSVSTTAKAEATLRSMVRNGHSSPFEQVVFTFILKMPVFVARQWIRHRTARLNEQSARYTEINESEFFVPDVNSTSKRILGKGIDNYETLSFEEVQKEELRLAKRICDDIISGNTQSYLTYKEHLTNAAPRELARVSLPVGMYTTFMWQIDLNNLMKFFSLRLDKHAQYEIRLYADMMYKIARTVAPVTIDAFNDFILNSCRLSKTEIEKILEHLPKSVKNDVELKPIWDRLISTNLNAYSIEKGVSIE